MVLSAHGMNAPVTETIAAVATARGRGGIGVLRISGPAAATIAERIAGALPLPRQAQLRGFRDSEGQIIDRGLVLWFPAPASFTGEDVIELQGHGGPALLQALLHAACAHGARPARPGEFSERAFLNGRIDLAQAEAVADLVDAASLDSVRAARRSMDGEFSRRTDALAVDIAALRVRVEGALDFSDEDVNWLSGREIPDKLESLNCDLRTLLEQAARGRRLIEGLNIVIGGRPNVGKSTLLNRLADADAAIVADEPGTTRDLLHEHLVVDGLPITLTDTAGLRDARNAVEREGVRRAWSAFEKADALLYLIDDRCGMTAEDLDLLTRLPATLQRLRVRNKCDLTGRPPRRDIEDGEICIRLAAGPDQGVQLLRTELRRMAGLEAGNEGLFSARTRHLDALRRCLQHLQSAAQLLQACSEAELIAEELRMAHQALAEITGAFSSEDLLGQIFSEFCIGK